MLVLPIEFYFSPVQRDGKLSKTFWKCPFQYSFDTLPRVGDRVVMVSNYGKGSLIGVFEHATDIRVMGTSRKVLFRTNMSGDDMQDFLLEEVPIWPPVPNWLD